MITVEDVVKVFENEQLYDWEGDNAFKGLQIISKYTDDLIQGADHDIIYSAEVDELIEAGMTLEEFAELRKLNWMLKDDRYLACFV